jgi:hypothetical protein
MDTTKNKIGIVCDNYKVKMFKRELSAAGFVFTTSSFKDNTTIIQVDGTPDK